MLQAASPTSPTTRRLRRSLHATLGTAGDASPAKDKKTTSPTSNTPAKAEQPGSTEKPGAAPSPEAGASSGATAHKPDKTSGKKEVLPPHKEDQEIIFDWRNNATTTLRRSLVWGENWDQNSRLPPGMLKRFCRIRFTPRAARDGGKQHAGYINLCVSCITFIDEDSSTPNRIGLYDMAACS